MSVRRLAGIPGFKIDQVAARHLRFVFSREPVERLGLRWERVRTALHAACSAQTWGAP